MGSVLREEERVRDRQTEGERQREGERQTEGEGRSGEEKPHKSNTVKHRTCTCRAQYHTCRQTGRKTGRQAGTEMVMYRLAHLSPLLFVRRIQTSPKGHSPSIKYHHHMRGSHLSTEASEGGCHCCYCPTRTRDRDRDSGSGSSVHNGTGSGG